MNYISIITLISTYFLEPLPMLTKYKNNPEFDRLIAISAFHRFSEIDQDANGKIDFNEAIAFQANIKTPRGKQLNVPEIHMKMLLIVVLVYHPNVC